MPYTKLIVITALLTNYSSASDIINPFADPSLILNSQIDYAQKEEVVSPIYNNSSSIDNSDIINPFTDQNIILNSKNSITEESFSPSSEVIVEELPITDYNPPTAPAINNTKFSSTTPTYQRATNQEVLDAKALPSSSDDSQSYNTLAPDIQGEYRFIRGTDLNVNKKVEDGYLVIEKLDETNFGYYYTFIVEKATPKIFFGIFNYDKGKFNQRVIKNEGSVETENLTNTNIVTDGNRLELEVNIQGGSQNTLWENDLGGVAPFKLQKSLKEAKQNYKEIYKDKFSQLTY